MSRGASEAVSPLFARCLSERRFQQQVLTLAGLRGWRVVHHWSSIHSAAGWPDLVLCRPPRLVVAELKAEHGRLTLAQLAWLDDLKACAGLDVYVWRPSDWDEIVELLA